MIRWVSAVSRAINVHILPQLSDNYSYVVHHKSSNKAFVVDVAEAGKVVGHLNQLGIPPTNCSILTTHKHGDHSGGNLDMQHQFSGLKVYGGEHDTIPGCTNAVKDGDRIPFVNNSSDDTWSFEVLFTPCHTRGHVLYVLRDERDLPVAVFTGDTVFAGGCGRFFEGSADDMFRGFSRLRGAVTGDTLMFPGHEYTVANYLFAKHYAPSNEAVLRRSTEAQRQRDEGVPTIPTKMSEEFVSNVFLLAPSVEALGATRAAKDVFKSV